MLKLFKPSVRRLEWKEQFARFGVLVHESGLLELLEDSATLLISNCSRTKGSSGDSAYPDQFYKGSMAQRTIRFAKWHKLPYGILSDLYGIHFHDECLPFYNIHPSQVVDKELLAGKLQEKCRDRGITKLVYCNSSPIRARFYLDLILMAGLQAVYTTQLRVIRKGLFDV